MAASHSVGVSSIQSQTPLLCRVHKGGVQFFLFAALSAHQCSHSHCRAIADAVGLSELLLSGKLQNGRKMVMSEKVCEILLLHPVQGFFAHFSNLFTRSSAST
jgi:hypothetical protein